MVTKTERGPGDTRQRILEAAENELVRLDPGGLRVDKVARSAAANKRMIYHYFGDREGLVEAVYGLQLARLLAAESRVSEGTRHLLEVLGHLIGVISLAQKTPAEPDAICKAARILLPCLIRGQNRVDELNEKVPMHQWSGFCVEMLSLAMAELPGVPGPEPGSVAFKNVCERLLSPGKPIYRLASDTRTR